MKTKSISLALSAFTLATAVLISSCRKNSSTQQVPDTSTTSSTDNNRAQQNSSDLLNFGSESMEKGDINTYHRLGAGTNGGGMFSPMSGSVTITSPASKQIQITFTNFVGQDNRLRNGTLLYDWNQSLPSVNYYRDSGLVLNVSTPLNDYVVEGYNVKINSKTIRNKGRIGGTLTWTDDVNLTITNGSSTIQWNASWIIGLLNTSSYNYTAANGSSSSQLYPAVFHGYGGGALNYIDWTQAIISVGGTFGGTASDGQTYTGNISSPLIANFNCTPAYTKYLYVSGVLNFTPTGKTMRSIDYGSGVCDLTYKVSIGSWSVTITI